MKILKDKLITPLLLSISCSVLLTVSDGSVLAQGTGTTTPKDAASATLVSMKTNKGSAVRGFLFSVTPPCAKSNCGKVAPSYLFGSIHVAKDNFYPMSPTVMKAFRESKALAVEADISDMSYQQDAMRELRLAPPDSLEKHIKSETWTALKAVLPEIAIPQLQFFKPPMVSSALVMMATVPAGYNPQLGIDLHFINEAKKMKKSVLEVEGTLFQAKLLGKVNDEDGDLMLASTLEALQKQEIVPLIDDLAASWLKGDDVAMAKLLEAMNKDEASKRLNKLMFQDRHPNMSEKIQSLMKEHGHVFVVVGSGHLVGKDSVVDYLRKAGYRVERIQ